MLAKKNAEELELAQKKFDILEYAELNAIDKLKVTQNTHSSAQFDLERAIAANQDAFNNRKNYRLKRKMEAS